MNGLRQDLLNLNFMLRKFSEDLLREVEGQAALAEEKKGDALKRMTAVAGAVRAALKELRKYVETHPFTDEGEEIWFFREMKPRFYALKVYAIERYTIEINLPADLQERVKYYKEQLQYISRFFTQHAFTYQYYKLGARELDRLYFIRGVEVQHILLPEVPELDPAFSTSCDYLFSKFMAYEQLQSYLLEQLSFGQSEAAAPPVSKKGRQTKWTGDTCNLIEMVYGIYETKQVNNGDVDLSDLMDVFEQCFGVNLSRYFRRFTEIKRRKAMSKTRFLDEMREAVNKRIDDGDAYRPDLNKRFSSY